MAAEHQSAAEVTPEFYVALELVGDGECCRPGLLYAPLTEGIVRATATGTALAAITPPRPYGTFIGVTAAADNRTFVLAAQKLARLPLLAAPATRFFLLVINPASRVPAERARLTPLPIPEQPPGMAVSGLALSPDATMLAVTAGPFMAFMAPALHTFTLATGTGRIWNGPRVGPSFGPGAVHGSLSWAADGHTLALISSGVRLLNIAAPGNDLLASSRLVLPTPTGPVNRSGNYWRQVMISPNGQTIIAVLQIDVHDATGHMSGVTQQIVTFSARTGELLHTLNSIPVHGCYQQILWASPSGQLLIISGTEPGPTIGPFNLGHNAGAYSHGRFAPLPWSNRTFAAAW